LISRRLYTLGQLFLTEFFNTEGIEICKFSGHDDSLSYRKFGPSNQMDSVNSLISQPRDAMSAGLNCEGTCRQDIFSHSSWTVATLFEKKMQVTKVETLSNVMLFLSLSRNKHSRFHICQELVWRRTKIVPKVWRPWNGFHF